MLVMKRKINNETDRYGGFDSTIEVDEEKPKSYRESASFSYTSRENAKTPVMPTIRTTGKTARKNKVAKPERAQQDAAAVQNDRRVQVREALNAKTKIMLAIYITLAIALSAIVIGTGMAISSAAGRTDDVEGRLASQMEYNFGLFDELEDFSKDYFMFGLASDPDGLNMEPVNEEEIVGFKVIPMAETTEYKPHRNAFDKFRDFISRIFN